MVKMVALTALYYAVFIPARLITLIAGDPLHRRWKPSHTTYWITVNGAGSL